MKLRHSWSPTLTAHDILSFMQSCVLPGACAVLLQQLGASVGLGRHSGHQCCAHLFLGLLEMGPKAPYGIFLQLPRESIGAPGRGAAAQPCALHQPCWRDGHRATLSLWVTQGVTQKSSRELLDSSWRCSTASLGPLTLPLEPICSIPGMHHLPCCGPGCFSGKGTPRATCWDTQSCEQTPPMEQSKSWAGDLINRVCRANPISS